MIILTTVRSMVRKSVVYSIDWKRVKQLMLGLKESMDQLAMVISVHWYDRVLRMEDSHVFRTLEFSVEGQRRKGGHKMMWMV